MASGRSPALPDPIEHIRDDARGALRADGRGEQRSHRLMTARARHLVEARLEQCPDRFGKVGRRIVGTGDKSVR